MVQGLAFLSKKSWHTKNLANQEKVWQAEQRKEAEDRKTKELTQQMAQEREQEELEALTGRKSKLDRGIDWMYQGQSAQSEIAQQDQAKQAEEYLLGKAYEPAGAPRGDLDVDKTAEGVNAVVAQSAKMPPPTSQPESSSSLSHQPTVAERNEAFRHRHEDPMFAVSKQAYQQHKDYEKTKQLYERVTGGVAVDKDKKKKKHKKPSKKHHGKRKHHDSDEGTSSRSDNLLSLSRRHKKRKQSRQGHSSEGSERSYREMQERNCRREARKRSRSRSSEPSSRRLRGEPKRRSRSRSSEHSPRRPRSRHRDDAHYGVRCDDSRDGHRYRRRDQSLDRHKRTSRRSPSPVPRSRVKDDRAGDYSRNGHTGQNAPRSDAVYGLQGGDRQRPPPSLSSRDGLGPDAQLLDQRRRDREAQRHERVHGHNRQRRQMSAAERDQALRDMQSDARQHRRQKDNIRRQQHGRKDDADDAAERRGHAAFLMQTGQQVASGSSLADRLAQNQHRNQRDHNASFL